MLYNAKKVQFDTEEIQKVIENSENLHYQMGKVVEEGMLGIPIEAVVNLATIHLPMNEKDNKEWEQFIDKKYGNTKGFKLFKPKSDEPFMGIGRMKPKVVCHIYCNTGSILADYRFKPFDASTISQFSISNIETLVTLYGSEDQLKDNPRCLERISNLALEIQETYFGTGWTLELGSGSNLKEYLTTNFFNTLEEALIQIKENLKAGKIGIPTIAYETINDVLALNLIKIIDKGSDWEKNFYTGNSKGLVVEALIIDKQADDTEYNSNIIILKSFIEYYNIHKGFGRREINSRELKNSENYFNSNILALDNIKNIRCTHKIVREFIDIESMKTFKLLVDKENQEKEKLYQHQEQEQPEDTLENSLFDGNMFESAEKFRFDNIDKFESSPSIFYVDEGMRSVSFNNSDEELLWLLIPKGIDLSNSFKAKYI